MSTLDAPARLALLLPWFNGDLDEYVMNPGDRPEDAAVWTDFDEVRRVLDVFVRSFDGSASCAFLAAAPDDTVADVSEDRLDDLRATLRVLLDVGFADRRQDDYFAGYPTPSLRFQARGVARTKPGWTNTKKGQRVRVGGSKAVADYRAAGAYVLQVFGKSVDLLPFLVTHLLTQADMVAVRQCACVQCDRLFVTGSGRGRPQRFCRESCQKRQQEIDEEKKRAKTKSQSTKRSKR
jgi:hypothetical protein